MKLAIGCPVLQRDWILEDWFNHLEVALGEAGVPFEDVVWVFAGDPSTDENTWEIIHSRVSDDRLVSVPTTNERSVVFEDSYGPRYIRTWNPPLYQRMTDLRNQLLGAVREIQPEAFLSLDSDILCHPLHLKSMLEALDGGVDAVGGKCYLGITGKREPSWGSISPTGKLVRADAEGLFPVQVIMAMKLMSPLAYNVDYETHQHGEDIGWSLACKRAGLRFLWDGRYCSKHIYTPPYLGEPDERCGW